MRTRLMPFMLMALVACGGGEPQDSALADSLERDLQLVPADTTAVLDDAPAGQAPQPAPQRPAAQRPAAQQPTAQAPRPASPAPLELASGTRFQATAMDSISSRHNKPGQTMRVRVAADVSDDRGRVVIPAGSVMTLTIAALAPSENKGDSTGVLRLVPSSVEIDGASYTLAGRVSNVDYSLKGRGVTAGDAAKVGAGAAAGAAAGQILGKKTTSTVIGGIVGAAAGAAIATNSADRDVVVAAGAGMSITLDQPFTRT